MVSELRGLGAGAGAERHRTLADRAFAALHDAIVMGQLAPGERLPIEELGEALGMSAMPIREALRRLDAAGLVENIPHRGGRVTQLSIGDLGEVYEARLALEPLAIARAAARFDERQTALAGERLAVLDGLIAENSPDTWAAHTAFHFALYEAGDSSWLLRLIRPLWDTSQRYRLALNIARDPHTRFAEREWILQACINHDADLAARAQRIIRLKAGVIVAEK